MSPNGGVCGLLVKPGEPGSVKFLIAPGIFSIFFCIKPFSFNGLPSSPYSNLPFLSI